MKRAVLLENGEVRIDKLEKRENFPEEPVSTPTLGERVAELEEALTMILEGVTE